MCDTKVLVLIRGEAFRGSKSQRSAKGCRKTEGCPLLQQRALQSIDTHVLSVLKKCYHVTVAVDVVFGLNSITESFRDWCETILQCKCYRHMDKTWPSARKGWCMSLSWVSQQIEYTHVLVTRPDMMWISDVSTPQMGTRIETLCDQPDTYKNGTRLINDAFLVIPTKLIKQLVDYIARHADEYTTHSSLHDLRRVFEVDTILRERRYTRGPNGLYHMI